jgi:hypothetical protein
VQQRGGEPLRVEPPLRQDARDRERMRDVRLARLAELPAVGGIENWNARSTSAMSGCGR